MQHICQQQHKGCGGRKLYWSEGLTSDGNLSHRNKNKTKEPGTVN